MSSTILRRKNALLAALLLGGVSICGVAAVGYLGTGGWQAAGDAAALHAGAVAPVGPSGESEDAATAMPEAAGQPAQASVPGNGTGSATTRERAASASASASRSPSPSPTSGGPSPSSSSPSSPSLSPTASSPDPTASSPDPSATPPAAGGATCANPSFTTSAQWGTWNLYPYYVSNDMWNASGSSMSQTLKACSAGNWYVTATVNDPTGDVMTYPNSRYQLDNAPKISSLNEVTSTFADSGPNAGGYEDAYDIWLNGVADSGSNNDELMIWTQNHGQTPIGSPVTTATIDGCSYTAWRGNRENGGAYMAFVAKSGFASGTMNLMAFFQWVIAQGWVPADPTLNQVDYGVEISSTDNAPATFSFSDFSVNVG
jgi:hypothetical protein